ncbi:MAG: protein kinase domain-containing protein, partial [Planctomycetota bacterium]
MGHVQGDDSTHTHVALTRGTLVQHYQIVEKIGAGGMGEVYLAEDTKLKRQVALKFMPAHLAADDDMRSRFSREAQAAAKLDHPNIVPVYEVGEFQKRPFIAMAHIEGELLRDVIKKGKLSVSESIELTMQICEGLHKAHQSGIVHRDIKPGNIIIDNSCRARLLDFGLATVSGEDKLTKTGSTLGTVGYMAPEQIASKKVDRRADLFSTGVILYEMITGRRPFTGDNDAAVVQAITDTSTAPEPIARFKSGTAGEIQQIIDKALAKKPSVRYQHADEMLADLKRLSIESASPKKNRAGLWATAAVIIIVGGYFISSLLTKTPDIPIQAEPPVLIVLPFENLGSEDDEYFSDGIREEISTRLLATVKGLRVISPRSADKYKGSDKSIQQIGQETGADYTLEATIRWDKSGQVNRIRITPRL